MRDAGESAALLTGDGKLITGSTLEDAPFGASFAEAPAFAVVRCQTEPEPTKAVALRMPRHSDT